MEQNASLRLELFVQDIPASIAFYRDVLGFDIGEQHDDGYTPMTHGAVRVSLNARSFLSEESPIYIPPGGHVGRGVEIVLEVDDVDAMAEHVWGSGWELDDDLTKQDWGLTDFRVKDPDGYYWRVTSRE